MRHNSDNRAKSSDFSAGRAVNVRETELLPALPGQTEFLDKMLTGSQRKTAFSIRYNTEKMIRQDGLNCCGFLTLTVGDASPGGFCQVWDSAEASRRINNLNRRVLADLFERAIIVTERHKNGAIHFHIIGTLRGRPNIRTGFDFDNFTKAREARKAGWKHHAAEIRYKMAACDDLRARWAMLREVLPRYGFGRAELTPIRKTGEAVACYISKYIEKNVCNRLPADKGKKLVRYIGWNKVQMTANVFEWDGIRARVWRSNATTVAAVGGCKLVDKVVEPPSCFHDGNPDFLKKIRPKMLDGSAVRAKFGPRWAWHFTGIKREIFGEDIQPKLEMTPGRYCKLLRTLDALAGRYQKSIIEGFREWKMDVGPEFYEGTAIDDPEWMVHQRWFEMSEVERDLTVGEVCRKNISGANDVKSTSEQPENTAQNAGLSGGWLMRLGNFRSQKNESGVQSAEPTTRTVVAKIPLNIGHSGRITGPRNGVRNKGFYDYVTASN